MQREPGFYWVCKQKGQAPIPAELCSDGSWEVLGFYGQHNEPEEILARLTPPEQERYTVLPDGRTAIVGQNGPDILVSGITPPEEK